ncbi:MAG: cyclic nucleotide-binding domain-containing protein [Geothrix sp.]|nr:cyclic nucleotide-binding domain-containing protein [Geothrix sp.]
MVPRQPALTATESRLLLAVGNWDEGRLPPTLRDLASELGWRSVAAVREYLGRLQAKGLLRLEPGRARSVRLTEQGRARLRTRPTIQRGTLTGSAALDGAQAVMRLLEEQAQTRTLPKGGFLWQEGDPADRLVRVEHGLLRAFRTFEDGRTTTLLRFGAGDVLGFSPFFDGAGYPASVEALEPARVLVVHRQGLESALRDPQVGMALLSVLARRLRKAFDTIEQLSIRGALNRVASAVLPLVPGGPYPVLVLPGTARAFAESIGLTPASLSRALALLVLHGVLHKLGPRRYQVTSLDRLRRLAAGVESDRT